MIAQHKFIDGLNAGPRIVYQTMSASLDAMRDHAMLLEGLSVLGR